MALPIWGTFDYFVVIPDGRVLPNEQPWNVQSRDEGSDDPNLQARLVGQSPFLEITDGGPTPNPNVKRPAVSRARFTLKAATRKLSTARSASFYVDQCLLRYFAAGDHLNIVRTGISDLGLSLTRGDALIFALGAVSVVSLGTNIRVTTPWDLTERMAAILQRRDPQFGRSPIAATFRELPVEININGHNRIVYSGRIESGRYEVWVEHGHVPGMDGARHECVAIWDTELCGGATVIGSLQLLDQGLEIADA